MNSSNKLKNFLSRKSEQLINTVRNSAGSTTIFNQSSEEDLLDELDAKERSASLVSSSVGDGTEEAEGFICPQCLAAFPNPDLLTEHFSSEHSVTSATDIRCWQCKMKLNSEEELETHIEKYHTLKSDKPMVAVLDEKIQQDMAANFNRLVQLSTAAGASKMTPDEVTLLERQQKALEETKDLLLKELATMRNEIQKKDELLEKCFSMMGPEKIQMTDCVYPVNHFDQKDQTESVKNLSEQLQNYKNKYEGILEEHNILLALNESKETDMANLRALNENLTQELKLLQGNLKETERQLHEANEQTIPELNARMNTEVKKAIRERDELSNEIVQIKNNMGMLEQDNTDLKNQIALLKSSSEKTQEERYLQMERLKDQEIERTRQFVQHFQSENHTLRNQLRSKCKSIQDQLQTEKMALIQIRSILKEHWNEFSKMPNVLVKTFDEYSKKLFDAGIASTANELKQVKTNNQELTAKLSETSAEMEKINYQRKLYEEEIKKLKNELKLEMIAHEEALASSQNEFETRLSQTKEASEEKHGKELQQLQTEIELMQIEHKKKLNEKTNEFTNMVNEAQNELKKSCIKLNEEIKEWQSRYDDLSKKKLQLDNLYAGLINQVIPEQKSQISDLTEQLTHLQSELNELTAKHSEEIKRYQGQYQSLATDKTVLEHECRTLKEKFKEKENEAQLLTEKSNGLFERISALESKYQNEIKKLNLAKCQLQSELDTMVSKHETFVNQELPAKEKKIVELMEHEEKLLANQKTLQKQIDELKSSQSSGKKALASAIQEKNNLIARIEKNQARLEDLKQQHDKVLSDKLRLEIEMSTCVEEKRALLERCVASEEELVKSNHEITDLSRKLDENVQAVHELGMQNQNLQIQMEALNLKQKRAWADDRLVDKCMNQQCSKLFTTVVRKHHCRQCGNIFCNDCSSKTAQLAGHPKPVRVCDLCHQELTQS